MQLFLDKTNTYYLLLFTAIRYTYIQLLSCHLALAKLMPFPVCNINFYKYIWNTTNCMTSIYNNIYSVSLEINNVGAAS